MFGAVSTCYWRQTLLDGNCTVVLPMNAMKMVPSTTACYTLTLDQTVYSNVFKLDLSSTSAVAFFAEHVPTEFERSAHYFIDKNGESNRLKTARGGFCLSFLTDIRAVFAQVRTLNQ